MRKEFIRPIDAHAAHAIDWPRQPSVGFSSDSRLTAALPRTATGRPKLLSPGESSCSLILKVPAGRAEIPFSFGGSQ
jgi:hypothetical protein